MRRLCLIAVVVLLGVSGLGGSTASAADLGPTYRRIHFPVEGAASFSDDFGDPRGGGRTHEGNDILGHKLQKLLAAADGTVVSARVDAGGRSGNMLVLRDAAGWHYRYIHLNNDTPGSDDGANPPEWVFAPGITAGVRVAAGQHVAFLGDSGNAEATSPHLHFELRDPSGAAVNPWASLRLARGLPAGNRCGYDENPLPASTPAPGGYYVLGDDGGIFTFGDARYFGSVPGLELTSRVTALRLAATPGGGGYRILGADGGIFTFGDAAYHGSVPGLGLTSVRALDLQQTRTGDGYWVLGDDGGVFTFGDAEYYGSVPGLGIRTRAIRLVPTPTGRGYWVLGVDGGVFSFGDARFAGSLPGLGLPSASAVAMVSPTRPGGYWVLAADGGVFSFGLPFHGSIPGVGLCRAPRGVQMAATATGDGYWVVAADGSVFAFGDAAHHGDPAALGLSVRAVDLAAISPR